MGSKAKILFTVLAIVALGIVGFNAIGVAAQSAGQVDISGPCDEAEHANDPECTGADVDPSPEDSPSVEAGEDISGPCDEAEHANDPRCTGDAVDDDNSGPSGDDDDNSGPSDNSGHGGDDDDSGHGGDDDDSGHGDDDD